MRIEELNQAVNAPIVPGKTYSSLKPGTMSEVDAGHGEVAIRRVYDLRNKVGKRTQVTIFDQRAIELTEGIARAINDAESSLFRQCRLLYKVKKEKIYEKMGFKTVAEYGNAMFDYKTTTVNQYARIGEFFIDDNYHVVGDLPALSISHYLEFLAYIEDKKNEPARLKIGDIRQMYIDGKLTDGMNTKVLRAKLAEAAKGKEAIETSFVDDGNEGNEGNEGDENNENNESNEGNEGNENNEGNEGNETLFDKSAELQRALTAIKELYNVSESLKSHGIEVTFNDALDSIMESVKSMF